MKGRTKNQEDTSPTRDRRAVLFVRLWGTVWSASVSACTTGGYTFLYCHCCRITLYVTAELSWDSFELSDTLPRQPTQRKTWKTRHLLLGQNELLKSVPNIVAGQKILQISERRHPWRAQTIQWTTLFEQVGERTKCCSVSKIRSTSGTHVRLCWSTNYLPLSETDEKWAPGRTPTLSSVDYR